MPSSWSDEEAILKIVLDALRSSPGLAVSVGTPILGKETVLPHADLDLPSEIPDLDLVVQSASGIIGVELKMTRHANEPMPSFFEAQLSEYSDELSKAAESLRKVAAHLLLATNYNLSEEAKGRLKARRIDFIQIRSADEGASKILDALKRELGPSPTPLIGQPQYEGPESDLYSGRPKSGARP